MTIPINDEDLLRQRKVESNWLELRQGRNHDRVYRSIYAFTNDFDNIGGIYLVRMEDVSVIKKYAKKWIRILTYRLRRL